MHCPNHLILSCSLYSGHPLLQPQQVSFILLPFIISPVSLSTFHQTPYSTHISMAKVGKLTKLKSAIKRWPSFPKLGGTATSRDVNVRKLSTDRKEQQLHAVYVGKSRRRYLVNSDVVDHPVFQELVERSAAAEGEDGGVVVACEVVLFEHLLWILENAETQMGSMDELVEFYTCAW